MQPVTTADGITFIRDDWKAPLWTVDASFDITATPGSGTLKGWMASSSASNSRLKSDAQNVFHPPSIGVTSEVTVASACLLPVSE